MTGFCNFANDAVCNAHGCCPACENSFEEYEACLGNIWFGDCQFDCEEAPTPSPTLPVPSSTPSTEDERTILSNELEGAGCLDLFGDFVGCVFRNPLQCISCFASHLPNFSDAFKDGFCRTAEDSICSFGACCDPCENEFLAFDQCFEQIVEEVTSCTFDCDEYFEEGEIVNPLDPSCVAKLRTYTTCLSQNPWDCGTCALLNFPTFNVCEIATDSICDFSECCSECEEEFQEFDECFEAWVSLATLGQCDIECGEEGTK
eukprot:CAMPEP_0178906274 /NCGR_PEP_ID=MMETSP0786-20121207/6732_1 /TAXON_ID=186022 /ORGANISM="Thalassionema frauenfeldii, Strain CCMP 1798" /LENGTH=259 /DNA_ID=CAMNT_0020577959 /DNA_START=93 /DNA_END=872 /DNA_ORIENTATION=-